MKFTVLSKKWGHKNIYGIKITSTGWYIRYASIGGDCNDRGEPYLYELLDKDYIEYPESLGDYLSFLWERSQRKGNSWIQERLNELSEWLISEESNKLDDAFWNESRIRA
ncbi:MAG: hypothetical protein JW825_04000 [Candidatus Methanofastidiosa archaeon]|nr:hypothetical protein [Candidatus Methanofastidiosa archaeon]